jgi:hypothetical protein
LLLLASKGHGSPARDHLSHLFGLMSHYHDDGIARDPAGGLNHVGHHGFSKNLMQHLGLARLHAFAESCGQYDDRKAPIHEFSFQQCGPKKTKGQIRAWIAL